MKLILITLFALLSLNSVNAKETTFNQKNGILDAQCVVVSDGIGTYHAWLEQRGRSSDFELKHAKPVKEGDCPTVLNEGDSCEKIEDISGTVEVTGGGCDENIICTTTRVIEGSVIDGSCKINGDSCLINGIQGIVKDGFCIDLV